MRSSDKELMTSDGRQSNTKFFCLAHMKKKRIILMILLSLVSVLTLVVMFGIYAVFRVYDLDSHHSPISHRIEMTCMKPFELVRKKRTINEITKFTENKLDFDMDKNMIKRNTDFDNIESFLSKKYREVNKNDASEEFSDEDNTFVQKRSSDLKSSIRKLERTIQENENLIRTLVGKTDRSEETANLIAKDLDDVESELNGMDDDIVSLLETAHMTDNSIHKRIRHKRETDFTSFDIDPIALQLFAPRLEEKKREKRLVQQKLAEVRDEFIRCKKSALSEGSNNCEGIYHRVMDRFREITKKFKEIEEIVEEMEHFNPSRAAGSDERKKKKDKKKKKEKKSSEESKESSEENKKKKKTTTSTPEVLTTTENIFNDSTDVPTAFFDSTTEAQMTVETTTMLEEHPDSSENEVRFASFERRKPQAAYAEPDTIYELPADESSLKLTSTETCPVSAFDSEIRAHPKFHSDLEDNHSTHKFFQNHPTLDELVAKKIERNQGNPFQNALEDLEDVKFMTDGARDLVKDVVIADDNQQLGTESEIVSRAQSSPKSTFKNSDTIGASGPFIALCEQMAKQGKQAQETLSPQQPSQQHQFAPIQIPLSGFSNGVHFPPTGETSKATSKVFMNPNYNMMMQYPICFVNYPQYRSPQPFYYPGLMPVTQPGKFDDTIDPEFIRAPNAEGYFMTSAGPNMKPIQVPIGNQGFAPNQGSYRESNDKPLEQQQPTYCTFLASDNANFPAHYSETTEQPTTQKYAAASSDGKIEEFALEPERSDGGDRANAFNIPTQFDIIYATYPNQLFAMNHSTQHRHCDPGKLPCFGTNQCINKSKWCDSKVDCLDASDETACSCKSRLAENRICDGFIDCPMGSDELGCFGCDKFQYSCYNSRAEFEENGQSSSLMCYSSVEKCDGFNNCRNSKDESECSMIVRHVGAMLSYAVSHSEGILHHNFKGRWYPVCRNANNWAVDSCEMEIGKLGAQPISSIKISMIPGPFIQPNINQQNQVIDSDPIFSDNCHLDRIQSDENHVIFVKCPQPQCGISKLLEQKIPALRQNMNLTRHKRDAEARIVGGSDAKAMEFPFIVAIYKDGNFHCGGSIYSEFWIITAAHCTKNFENHYYEIRAGILRRSSYSPSAQISKVSHVIRHPNYERGTMKNDIALMKVKHSFSFNRWVRPVCLPSKDRTSSGNNWKFGPAPGTLCSTLGWGAIREKGPDPDDLKVVDVPILSKCKYAFDQEGDSVCAGETFGTRDACQGDSGGPFVCKSLNNPSELYLTGIVSHGEGCARANEPGVYTRVALYLDWIRVNTDDQPSSSNIPQQHCPGHTCVWGGSKCISFSERCDGFVDCLGGEDEIECTVNWLDVLLGNNATENSNLTSIEPVKILSDDSFGNKSIIKKDLESFRCTEISQVINMKERCDRRFDCEDGSDEENCTCRDYLKLAMPRLICDGFVDCPDSSDETDCLKCNATEFACIDSKTCISKSLHCDGEVDCKFREDEIECLALTDGNSVSVDLNGKPFMELSGIVTRNVNSTWKILCDDNGDFHTNGLQIANDVCNVIGFKSAKWFKVVAVSSIDLNEKIEGPDGETIDIRTKHLRNKDSISKEECLALEISCTPFQSGAMSLFPIQLDKGKKNSTIPQPSPQEPEIIFVPVNPKDPTNVIVVPVNKTKGHKWNHLRDFNWPWSAEIFVNGDLVANGILLDKSWVLVEKSFLGISREPLHENYVVALLGNTKSHLTMQSPYEQLVKVDCLQLIDDSNVILLHLDTPLDFNRHVLPSFLPLSNETESDASCLAVAPDSHQTTKTLGLKIIRNCRNEVDLVCYQQAANVTEVLQCDGETSHRSAAIVCKSKTGGWYPKAFHQLTKGFCDFLEAVSVFNLKSGDSYQQIKKIIDHPCEKCEHRSMPIACETHRCPLGKCIEKHKLCDGNIDCHDGSDELPEICHKIPPNERPCGPKEFRCQNGKCIDKSKFCNHVSDCGDKSDEPSECTCFSYIRATDKSKICDGVRHCWDKTDEDPTYCGTSCSGASFKCGSSAFCIPLEMVCDKRADCLNGADEEFCHGIYQYDTNGGYGEVMQRSFGIWHTKCFPKASPPRQDELEDLCKKLGFKDVTKVVGRITNTTQRSDDKNTQSRNSTVTEIPVEFKMFNATKVIAYSKFSAVKINDGFTVHLRPSKPLAKLVSWEKSDHDNCHRMEVKCSSDK